MFAEFYKIMKFQENISSQKGVKKIFCYFFDENHNESMENDINKHINELCTFFSSVEMLIMRKEDTWKRRIDTKRHSPVKWDFVCIRLHFVCNLKSVISFIAIAMWIIYIEWEMQNPWIPIFNWQWNVFNSKHSMNITLKLRHFFFVPLHLLSYRISHSALLFLSHINGI